MHSATDPGLERTKKLLKSDGSKKRRGEKLKSKRRERGNTKTNHVKSLDSMRIRCQVEKTKGLMKLRPAE